MRDVVTVNKACLVEATILEGSWLVLKMFFRDHIVIGWLGIQSVKIGQSISDTKVVKAGDNEHLV
jgi:hypothetical protein